MEKLKSFIKKILDIVKDPETMRYIIFGVLTTVVDYGVFWLLNDLLKLPSEDLSNFISQVCAMLFAFITNKLIVFRETTKNPLTILKMFAVFAGLRTSAILLNSGFFFIFNTKLGYNEYLVKFVGSVAVVILNFFFSKLIVFKHRRKEK